MSEGDVLQFRVAPGTCCPICSKEIVEDEPVFQARDVSGVFGAAERLVYVHVECAFREVAAGDASFTTLAEFYRLICALL